MKPEDLLAAVSDIALRAGDAIMEVYHGGFEVAAKPDESPVTAADLASERLILPALEALAPEIPAVSEEAVAEGRTPDVSGGRFWLVDPLDGTREFVNHRPEFTVNIALVEAGSPVLGVVGTPARRAIYAGAGAGTARASEDGGPTRPIAARPPPAEGLTVAASRSHGDTARLEDYLRGVQVAATTRIGSALKFVLLAKGEADFYPRFGPTMEWDTAAGHALLAAAGGRVETEDGAPLRYGKPGFRNPPFVAFGRRP